MSTINHLSAGMRVLHEATGYEGIVVRFYHPLVGETRAVCFERLGDLAVQRRDFPIDELVALSDGVESAFGERVESIEDITPGDLLYDGSVTYEGMPNVLRVLRWRDAPEGERPQGFYAVFVDPANPSQLRRADDLEFHVWDFMVPGEGFHRADDLCAVPDCLPPELG
jgi:hypothetical protein